ncbi:putative NACHT domain-containing protein [Seiridium cardinale]|uniref:NACHT domain-containing protein n=1 Tax=Seiridium cardinale TaxID=138064 RepID=A0ABR2X868_9PEZI
MPHNASACSPNSIPAPGSLDIPTNINVGLTPLTNNAEAGMAICCAPNPANLADDGCTLWCELPQSFMDNITKHRQSGIADELTYCLNHSGQNLTDLVTTAASPASLGPKSVTPISARVADTFLEDEPLWVGSIIGKAGEDQKICQHIFGGQKSHSTVYDIAWDFLIALEAQRRTDPLRPIIFIAHSLGGIVIKEMLRRSNGCQDSRAFLQSIAKAHPRHHILWYSARWCRPASMGLAEIVRGPNHDSRVQFLHETVRGFLLKQDGLNKICSHLEESHEGMAHEVLKRSCATYIHNCWAKVPPRRSQFLEYSVRNMFWHADKAQEAGFEQSGFLLTLNQELWLKLNMNFGVTKFNQGSRLLYILAAKGCSNLVAAMH